MRNKHTRSAAILVAAAVVAMAGLASPAAHGVEVESATDLVRCIEVGDEAFCTSFGYVAKRGAVEILAEVTAIEERLTTASKSQQVKPDDGGDLSMDELVSRLINLAPSERATLQNEQLQQARDTYAVEKRAAKTQLVVPAAVVPASMFVTSMMDFKTEWKKYKQERSYWCGPATMDAIARGNGKTSNNQTYWAGQLGTTTAGTGITEIVAKINSKTTWDNKGGTYKVRSVYNADTSKNRSLAWFTGKLKDRLAEKAPVVLHPVLRTNYFTHVSFNHGGHFQPGIGYTNDIIGFLEVYNEKDFMSNGSQSAGFRAVGFGAQYDATRAAVTYLRTVGS